MSNVIAILTPGAGRSQERILQKYCIYFYEPFNTLAEYLSIFVLTMTIKIFVNAKH